MGSESIILSHILQEHMCLKLLKSTVFDQVIAGTGLVAEGVIFLNTVCLGVTFWDAW